MATDYYAEWKKNQPSVSAARVGRTVVPGAVISGGNAGDLADSNYYETQTAPLYNGGVTRTGAPGGTVPSSARVDVNGAEGPKYRTPRPDAGAEGPKRTDPVTNGDRRRVGVAPDARSRATRVATDPEYDAYVRANAQASLEKEMRYWDGLGLTDVRDILRGAERDGFDPSDPAAIQRIFDSAQYKNLYGNIQQARAAAGLSAMSPEAIQSMRNSYRDVLRSRGMPVGFYDDPSDFDKFLLSDMSPTELAGRVDTAQTVVGESVPPETAQAFKKYYGIGKAELAAYYLDPDRALPLLEKQAAAAELGGIGIDTGLRGAGVGFAESLVEDGVSGGQARAAFTDTVQERSRVNELAALSGQEKVRDRDSAKARLGLDGGTETRLKGLASQERARFGGSSGGTQSLAKDATRDY